MKGGLFLNLKTLKIAERRYVVNYNVAVFDYPTQQQIRIYNRPIKIDNRNVSRITTEHEENEELKRQKKPEERTEEEIQHSEYQSCRRSKDRLYNIIHSNTWDYFITLTFDREKTDSSDYDLVYKRLNTFLKNFKYRNHSDLQYVIVPEFHEDKIHFHLHGLIKNCDCLQFEFSGHYTKDHKRIYNITNWSYGFTSATRVKNNDKVCSYISKYISKDNLINIKGRHRYLCSRGLYRVQPQKLNVSPDDYIKKVVRKNDISYCKTVTCPQAYRKIRYLTIDKSTTI